MNEPLELESVPQRWHQPPAAPRVMTMVLEGEIGRDELVDVSAMLFGLHKKRISNVVVDLGQVTHFDYRGVKSLMRYADAFRNLGGDLRLSGLSAYLHAIFRSAGAHDAFDCYAQAADARQSFEQGVFVRGG